MRYGIELKPRAVRDIKVLPAAVQTRLLRRMEQVCDGLKGNVKRLTDFTPEYRLRVGDYRVLFEIVGETIIVYRVRHRREAYR